MWISLNDSHEFGICFEHDRVMQAELRHSISLWLSLSCQDNPINRSIGWSVDIIESLRGEWAAVCRSHLKRFRQLRSTKAILWLSEDSSHVYNFTETFMWSGTSTIVMQLISRNEPINEFDSAFRRISRTWCCARAIRRFYSSFDSWFSLTISLNTCSKTRMVQPAANSIWRSIPDNTARYITSTNNLFDHLNNATSAGTIRTLPTMELSESVGKVTADSISAWYAWVLPLASTLISHPCLCWITGESTPQHAGYTLRFRRDKSNVMAIRVVKASSWLHNSQADGT